jgi:hypothetical protein
LNASLNYRKKKLPVDCRPAANGEKSFKIPAYELFGGSSLFRFLEVVGQFGSNSLERLANI